MLQYNIQTPKQELVIQWNGDRFTLLTRKYGRVDHEAISVDSDQIPLAMVITILDYITTISPEHFRVSKTVS